MLRCSGVTRIGKQCSVTTSSTWTDNHGRLVAEPLLKGGELCLFHAKPFCTRPAQLDEFSRMLVFVLDLESTGIDITKDRIVEIAAVHAHSEVHMQGESFSTTVRVDPVILKERGEEAFAVHGITDNEIAAGPTFKQAWMRFEKWLADVKNNATKDNDLDSDDDIGLPAIQEEPVIVLLAHNGIRFDFPLLLCELLRNDISTTIFEQWYFIDTLHVFKSLDQHGCIKLQCLARETMTDPGNAHRALDDCVALRNVTNIFAQRFGTSMKHLLSLYLVELDLPSSVAQLTVLM